MSLRGEMHRRDVSMKVGLFIPCYIDAFFPEVGIATLQLLERLGCSVEYPLDQTCCGQPMANSGCQEDAPATQALFFPCFHDFPTLLAPSPPSLPPLPSHPPPHPPPPQRPTP